MALHEKAFWVMSFFLLGVLLSSLFPFGSSAFFPFLIGLLIILGIAISGRYNLALCALCLLLGSLYYGLRTTTLPEQLPSGVTSFTGVIQKVRVYTDRQTLTISVSKPGNFIVEATTQRYPTYAYGDAVRLSGALIKSKPEDARLLRAGIVGMMRFPQIELVASGQGNDFRQTLFAFRDRVAASFSRALPPEQAALMTGLTLGKSAVFSDTLQEEMKITGTTHLVALSGYNISIIGVGISAVLGFWFSRRVTFALSIVAIVLFVLMTGAEASVVRAAIMAIILLTAKRTGRIFLVRNAIAAAAFLMVLVNPRVLVFDIGFQLSFFAMLGLVYLQPALETLFRVDPEKRAWKLTSLFTTLAAQLAVLPFLLSYFGFASLISVIPNILILFFTPYTMLFGLFIFLASLISSYFALFVSLPARLLLSYELGVINFFAQFKIGITTESMPLAISFIYYIIFTVFIIRMHRRQAMLT
jgi:competence protein ComEC